MNWCEKCKDYPICVLTEKKPKCFTDRKTEPEFGKDTNVRSKDDPYIDIETGVLHWCGWEYKRIEPQTERKTGHWIYVGDGYADYCKCSECGNLSDHEENFCCECGADMRKEKNDGIR